MGNRPNSQLARGSVSPLLSAAGRGPEPLTTPSSPSDCLLLRSPCGTVLCHFRQPVSDLGKSASSLHGNGSPAHRAQAGVCRSQSKFQRSDSLETLIYWGHSESRTKFLGHPVNQSRHVQRAKTLLTGEVTQPSILTADVSLPPFALSMGANKSVSFTKESRFYFTPSDKRSFSFSPYPLSGTATHPSSMCSLRV